MKPGDLPPINEAIKFRMEQYGHNQSTTAKALGVPRGRMSELISGKRIPSLKVSAKLYEYGIPADVLFQTRAWKYLKENK